MDIQPKVRCSESAAGDRIQLVLANGLSSIPYFDKFLLLLAMMKARLK